MCNSFSGDVSLVPFGFTHQSTGKAAIDWGGTDAAEAKAAHEEARAAKTAMVSDVITPPNHFDDSSMTLDVNANSPQPLRCSLTRGILVVVHQPPLEGMGHTDES